MNKPLDTTPKGTNAPDAYEAAYMQEGTEVLHREKLTFPWYMHLLMLSILLVSVVPLFATLLLPLILLGGLTSIFFFLVWMMFASLRISVTHERVYLQYGLFGPKIPIQNIVLCKSEQYQAWKYGGYGIRYSIGEGAWCYNMVGDKGRAVRIHYKNDKGELKKLLVASLHHHYFADTVNRARLAMGHALSAEEQPVELGENERETSNKEAHSNTLAPQNPGSKPDQLSAEPIEEAQATPVSKKA